MVAHRSRREKVRRRLVSIPALMAATALLTLAIPLWFPILVVIDAVRVKLRFPLARLAVLGVMWCWIEMAGILRCFAVWATGRSHDEAHHFRIMAWWSGLLMKALELTIGIAPRVEGLEAVQSGNAIVLARHASLADSLLSGWVFSNVAALYPRYVLKRELLFDPCLDIVGLRVPNHFLDRGAADGGTELAALRDLGGHVGVGSVGVIFPEGTRANDRKRARALESIARTDPERAHRQSALRRLLPPRPTGSQAFLAGAPDADVIIAWHTGFDGLDTFAGMIEKLSAPLPEVRFVMTRFARAEIPNDDGFARWLDDRWLELDAEVDRALSTEA